MRAFQPLTLHVADEDFGPFLGEVPGHGFADTLPVPVTIPDFPSMRASLPLLRLVPLTFFG